MLGFLLKTVSENLPTCNPGDPYNIVTYIVAAVFVAIILGASLVRALRNPRMRAGKKAE